MNGDVLDNSASLIPSESTEKQQQTFNFTSNNDKNNGLTSVLHGFIVNGLALTAMMKTDLGENGEGDEHNNESLEEISEEIIPKKANQSTSTSKNQNSQNFNNSWHYVQQKEENDISSHFERKKFLNENFGDFEENGDERGKLAKKTYENSDFATEDSQKQQEKDLNLQNFNLEKSKKTNTFSLFSTKMLMTTMTDLGNKKEELDQMSHSSYKNNLMSFPVIEEPKNSKNDTITMPNMPPNIMPKKKKKKPYKELTLEQKVELIRLAERCTNLSQASIAERYAIAKSNVCRILQRKTEYVRALECAGFAGSRKRKLRTAINLVEENDVLINNERKNNLNLFEEEELNNNNSFNIPLYDKKEINKLIDGTWKNEVDETILDGKGEEDGGTSALHSHMSTVHHQKSRRVILCRCCNLAFRDKNELHKHLKNRNNDGTLSEDVLLPTIENNQPNSPQNYQNRQQNGINNEHEKESEKLINSKNSNKIQPTIETNNEDGNNTITSAFQLLQQQQQHFLLANLWNNILRQQTEQNSHENTKIDNGTFDQNEKFPSQHAASSSLKSTDNVNVFNCLNSSCSTSSNTCSSSSSSSSSVIVQTTKIAKTSITSPSIINSSSSSYISTPPTDSENDSILNNLHGNNDIKSQTSPSFSSIIYANSTTKCNTQRSEQTSTDSEQIQNCVQCALLKPKLLSVNERSNYLEACNTTFQNELIRLNAKCLLAEQCIRRLELELRQWRERNDVLRYRLLECREKVLAIIGGTHINGGGSISTADLSTFLGEMLKITLI